MKDLTTKRVIVIANYPGCPWKVGDVLPAMQQACLKWSEASDGIKTFFDDGYGTGNPEPICMEGEKFWISDSQVEASSANFRSLQWWEYRDISEMPEYVKLCDESIISNNRYDMGQPLFMKIARWGIYSGDPSLTNHGKVYAVPADYKADYRGETRMIVTHFIPATLDDYNQYIASKTQP